MDNRKEIPTIDLSHLVQKYGNVASIDAKELQADEEIQKLVQDIKDGFSSWGIVYVKGHAITEEELKKNFDLWAQFYKNPREAKMPFLIKDERFGYVPYKTEIFDPTKPIDLREAFDVYFGSNLEKEFATTFPDVHQAYTALNKQFLRVTKLMWNVLDICLGKTDEPFLAALHTAVLDGQKKNVSNLRSALYPNEEATREADQQRFRKHTDYGTITWIAQDEVGGLQAESPDGGFVDVTPKPGTILLLCADYYENWSSGKYKAVVHQVVENVHNKDRQSMIFFVQPDNTVTVKPLDGSEKYSSINIMEYYAKNSPVYQVRN